MATVQFVPETGAGLSDATSYITLEEFKQYWENEGYNYGPLTDNDVYRLCNKGTKYIDNNYRKGFPGYRATEEQVLEWPRSNAYYLDLFDIADNVVPVEVKNATCEAAYLLHSGEDLTATISKDGKVLEYEVKVDVIEEKTRYENGSSLYTDIYTTIDNALSRITGGVSDRFVLKAMRVGGESP